MNRCTSESIRKTVRSSHWRCSFNKKLFLKISQDSQENTRARVKVHVTESQLSCRPLCILPEIIEKRLQHSCFPVNFAKLLTTPFLQTVFERISLKNIEKILSSFVLLRIMTRTKPCICK